MKRVIDKYPPASQNTIPIPPAVAQYSYVIGTVLDDKHPGSHTHVYEHARHSYDEMHFITDKGVGPTRPDPYLHDHADSLVEDERDVLDVLNSSERKRLLRIVGDVGVGKSTFLRHMCSTHFNTPLFNNATPIVLNWIKFTASSLDPIPEIHSRFSQSVFSEFEKLFSVEKRKDIDRIAFETDNVFSPDRDICNNVDVADRESERTRLINKRIEHDTKEFALARLRTIGKESRNSAVIIFDNVDQLQPRVLDQLISFTIEVQTSVPFLVIVAVRDHSDRRFSIYDRRKVVPGWHMRLRAPNMRLMLNRRVEHFFSDGFDPAKHSGIFARRPKDAAKVCKNILDATLGDPDAYAFLAQWSNYSIRELFIVLGKLTRYSGATNSNLQMLGGELLPYKLDDCIKALALEDRFLYYPEDSTMYCIYSSGPRNRPLEHIIASRIMQRLRHVRDPIKLKTLESEFEGWGYSQHSFRHQIDMMIKKNIIWADSGPLKDLKKKSRVRLSYRGLLYVDRLISRTLYNFYMSFAIDSPSGNVLESAPPKDMLIKARSSSEDLNVDLISERVLALADLVGEAELGEFCRLQTIGDSALTSFRDLVGPTCIADEILNGLTSFVNSALETGGSVSGRYSIMPSNSILDQIQSSHSKWLEHAKRLSNGLEVGSVQ